jgi:hypothetical protein
MITEFISLCIASYFINGCEDRDVGNLALKKNDLDKEKEFDKFKIEIPKEHGTEKVYVYEFVGCVMKECGCVMDNQSSLPFLYLKKDSIRIGSSSIIYSLHKKYPSYYEYYSMGRKLKLKFYPEMDSVNGVGTYHLEFFINNKIKSKFLIIKKKVGMDV